MIFTFSCLINGIAAADHKVNADSVDMAIEYHDFRYKNHEFRGAFEYRQPEPPKTRNRTPH